jgi:putative nucleotidyltransferase with HDIG domain
MMNTVSCSTTILLVDDEPAVLDLLSRVLRPACGSGMIATAQGGHEALDLMEQQPFDVVITDLNMPIMSGAEFLAAVRRKHPRTVRLVFASEPEREVSFRLTGHAHQVLLKPDHLAIIKSAITRAVTLRNMVSVANLEKIVSHIDTLPSIPDIYLQMVEELKSPDASIGRIGEIIEQDMGMSAKVLKLINSAFFGVREHVSSPAQAATLLGLDILKALVLMIHIFSEQREAATPGLSMKNLWSHSLAVGLGAREIAANESIELTLSDEAFIAGLFHDIGQLVMASNLPEQYGAVFESLKKKSRPLVEVERELIGTTHAEVGAYLLALWGFADSAIEAAAYHHSSMNETATQAALCRPKWTTATSPASRWIPG